MIDKTLIFDLERISNEEPGFRAIGVMFSKDGQCVGRQACVMPSKSWRMEINDLSFPSKGTVDDVVNTIRSFLLDHRVDTAARHALMALADALNRGQVIEGSNVLVGHECNHEAIPS
jgi:hypothetical protein